MRGQRSRGWRGVGLGARGVGVDAHPRPQPQATGSARRRRGRGRHPTGGRMHHMRVARRNVARGRRDGRGRCPQVVVDRDDDGRRDPLPRMHARRGLSNHRAPRRAPQSSTTPRTTMAAPHVSQGTIGRRGRGTQTREDETDAGAICSPAPRQARPPPRHGDAPVNPVERMARCCSHLGETIPSTIGPWPTDAWRPLRRRLRSTTSPRRTSTAIARAVAQGPLRRRTSDDSNSRRHHGATRAGSARRARSSCWIVAGNSTGRPYISAAIRDNRVAAEVQQPHRCPRAAADGPPAEEEDRRRRAEARAGSVCRHPVTDVRRVPRATTADDDAAATACTITGRRGGRVAETSPAASQRRCAGGARFVDGGAFTASPLPTSGTSHAVHDLARRRTPRLHPRETGGEATTGPQPSTPRGAVVAPMAEDDAADARRLRVERGLSHRVAPEHTEGEGDERDDSADGRRLRRSQTQAHGGAGARWRTPISPDADGPQRGPVGARRGGVAARARHEDAAGMESARPPRG